MNKNGPKSSILYLRICSEQRQQRSSILPIMQISSSLRGQRAVMVGTGHLTQLWTCDREIKERLQHDVARTNQMEVKIIPRFHLYISALIQSLHLMPGNSSF
uniref:Uncharacterized protein n=2 Tax=Opuntia streptacantha TaxID=393608 RepID=A0A7C9ARQ2_OPUST